MRAELFQELTFIKVEKANEGVLVLVEEDSFDIVDVSYAGV
jgi:hypothetical protein